MDRLQRKCVIASAGFHLSLAFILIVGPAFLSSKNKSDDLPLLDCIPAKAIDEAFSSVGSPKPSPTPPAPPAPAPPAVATPLPPPTPRVREPDPPKEIVKPDKTNPDSLEPVKDPHKHKEIALTPVTHRPTNSTSSHVSETDDRARQLADQRRRMLQEIRNTADNVRNDVSAGTSIEISPGRGSGGEAYANYGQIVKSIYENAWIPPEDSASDNAVTTASVTISSDGTVVSSRIVKSSGESSVDSSVQRTLDSVTFVHRFPDTAKDKQRTFTIEFNLKAKRSLG